MGRSSGRTKVCRDAQKLCLFDCNQSVYTTDSRKCLSGVFTHRSYVAIRGLHTPELFSRGTHNEGKVGATDTCRGKLEGDPPTDKKNLLEACSTILFSGPLPSSSPSGISHTPPLYLPSLSSLPDLSLSSLISTHVISFSSLISHFSYISILSQMANLDLFQTFVNRCR